MKFIKSWCIEKQKHNANQASVFPSIALSSLLILVLNCEQVLVDVDYNQLTESHGGAHVGGSEHSGKLPNKDYPYTHDGEP